MKCKLLQINNMPKLITETNLTKTSWTQNYVFSKLAVFYCSNTKRELKEADSKMKVVKTRYHCYVCEVRFNGAPHFLMIKEGFENGMGIFTNVDITSKNLRNVFL